MNNSIIISLGFFSITVFSKAQQVLEPQLDPCSDPSSEIYYTDACASRACLTNALPWHEGGNHVGPRGSNEAGTCNYYDFVLKSNNNLAMWIKPSTKVGIGESNPLAKLEVLEADPLFDEVDFNKLLVSVRSLVGNSSSYNNFQHNEWIYRNNNFPNPHGWSNANLHDALSVDVSFLTPLVDTRTYWDRNAQYGTQQWGDLNQLHLKIKNNFMQVMEQPNAPNTSVFNLNVDASQTFNAFEIYSEHNQKINFQIYGNGITKIGEQPNQHNTSMLNVNVSGGNAFEVYDQGTQKINFKVKANGYCYAREINVMPTNITFPDYVFASNYQLKSLNELETFIKTNKHLPNIPSAKEVEKEGINVADMQIKQMEKIEEAFLYILQLKKENDILKERLEQLEFQLKK